MHECTRKKSTFSSTIEYTARKAVALSSMVLLICMSNSLTHKAKVTFYNGENKRNGNPLWVLKLKRKKRTKITEDRDNRSLSDKDRIYDSSE